MLDGENFLIPKFSGNAKERCDEAAWWRDPTFHRLVRENCQKEEKRRKPAVNVVLVYRYRDRLA